MGRESGSLLSACRPALKLVIRQAAQPCRSPWMIVCSADQPASQDACIGFVSCWCRVALQSTEGCMRGGCSHDRPHWIWLPGRVMGAAGDPKGPKTVHTLPIWCSPFAHGNLTSEAQPWCCTLLAPCLPWLCAVKAGVAQGLEQGWVQALGRTGHRCNRCRGWTRKRLGDAQLERGAQLWAPPPQTAACPKHCMPTPCMLMHGCQWAVPVVCVAGGTVQRSWQRFNHHCQHLHTVLQGLWVTAGC